MKKQKIFTQIITLLLIITAAYFINKHSLFQKTLELIENLGLWAGPSFVLIYAFACIFLVPSLFFCFAGGILFGFLPGALLSLTGQALGSVGALLIGRYFLRNWIVKKFENNETFHKLDRAVEKKGWKILTLARFSPIFPFSIGNYAFGSTGISAFQYGLAAVLGSIPSTLVYTYLGTLTGDLASLNLAERERTPLEWGLLVGGLIMTIVLSVYLKNVATKALQENR